MPTWITEINALDASNAAQTLRFADGALSGTGNYYEPRMKSSAVVYVSPSDGGNFKIFSTPNIGEIELINNDGALDYLVNYAVDGQTCKMAVINDDGSRTDYFTGTVDRMYEQNNSVFFRLKSMMDGLQKTHPVNKYAGTNSLPNGVEGVSTDIKGNVKPKVFGNVSTLTPILVNTSKLIYQVSDRSTCTVDAVYSGGAPITKTAGADYATMADLLDDTKAPAAGYWKAYQGYFRITTASSLTVTADAHDSNQTCGDVFASILAEVSISMDTTSKAALNAIGQCGLYLSSETNTLDLLDRITKSGGFYWYFVGSTVYAALFSLATTSSLILYDWSITAIQRKATGLGSNGVPVYDITQQCDPVETVQSQFAGIVSQTTVARLNQAYRTAEAKDSAVLTRHPLSEVLKIEGGCLRSLTDAGTVCSRLLAIAKARCDVVNLSASFNTVPTIPNLGAGVTIYSSRLGYAAGKLFTLVGYSLDIRRKTLTMDLIG